MVLVSLKGLRIDNLYDPKNVAYLHCQFSKLWKAHVTFKKTSIMLLETIKLLSEDHQRLMPGRRYSDGLHGALGERTFESRKRDLGICVHHIPKTVTDFMKSWNDWYCRY